VAADTVAAAVLAIKRESMDEHNSNGGDDMDGEDAVAHNSNNIGYYSSDDMTSDSTVVCRRQEYLLGELHSSVEGLSESMGKSVSRFGRFYKTAVSNCMDDEKGIHVRNQRG
jgi:hypothetical protein